MPFLPLLAFMGLVVGMFAFLAWPAYGKDARDGEHSQARSNVGAETTDHFYLWTTTMTVGKSSTGTLGYKKDSYGSFSTGADFYYPPFSPPPKHNFDPESSITVTSLTRHENNGTP